MRGLFTAGFVLASALVDATAIAPQIAPPDTVGHEVTRKVASERLSHYRSAHDDFITKEEVEFALERDVANLAYLHALITGLEDQIVLKQTFLVEISQPAVQVADDDTPESPCHGFLCRIKSFFDRIIGLGGQGGCHKGGRWGNHTHGNRTHGNHTHGNHTFPRPPWWRPHHPPGHGNHSHGNHSFPHHPPPWWRHGNHSHGNHSFHHPPFFCRPHHRGNHTHGPPHHGTPPFSAGQTCSCSQHHGPPLPIKVAVIGTLLSVLFITLRRRCHARRNTNGMTWRERREARRARCQAKRAEMKRRLASLWARVRGQEFWDGYAHGLQREQEEGLLEKKTIIEEEVDVICGEKEVLVEEKSVRVEEEEEDLMSMSQELASFRAAANMVGEIVDVKAQEGKRE